MHEKLKEARISKGYSQGKFSEVIAMEQTTYSRKERGKSSITEDEWDRFANALDVPKEEIKETNNPFSLKNENCTFNANSIGIQYVSIPQNVFDIIIKYNTKLKEENATLKCELQLLSK